jgi:hypothetical protein
MRRLVFTNEQVLFKCNDANTQEAMDATFFGTLELALNTLELLLKRGYFHGGLKNFYYSLAEHIIDYTKRELPYQSDVLNAMRGILQRYAHATCPTQQYWGIPTTLLAYTHCHLTRNTVLNKIIPASMRPQDRFNVSFAYGLLWTLKATCATARRPDFPNWSWAGWIGPIR